MKNYEKSRTHRHTDTHTELLLELLVGAKNLAPLRMTQLFWIRLSRKLNVGLEFLSHSFILLL